MKTLSTTLMSIIILCTIGHKSGAKRKEGKKNMINFVFFSSSSFFSFTFEYGAAYCTANAWMKTIRFPQICSKKTITIPKNIDWNRLKWWKYLSVLGFWFNFIAIAWTKTQRFIKINRQKKETTLICANVFLEWVRKCVHEPRHEPTHNYSCVVGSVIIIMIHSVMNLRPNNKCACTNCCCCFVRRKWYSVSFRTIRHEFKLDDVAKV